MNKLNKYEVEVGLYSGNIIVEVETYDSNPSESHLLDLAISEITYQLQGAKIRSYNTLQ